MDRLKSFLSLHKKACKTGLVILLALIILLSGFLFYARQKTGVWPWENGANSAKSSSTKSKSESLKNTSGQKSDDNKYKPGDCNTAKNGDSSTSKDKNGGEKVKNETTKPGDLGTPYGNHGKLSVSGVDLVDQSGNKFQLKGVSTHGLQWYPQYVNQSAFQYLRDSWGANVVRLAMYTGEGGYCAGGDKSKLEATIDTGVQAATALGMYVIIDWHILSDSNPTQHQAESIDFFTRMSQKYAANGNVLYEICNEPNGGTSWSTIHDYAEAVVPAIRANAPDAIILVGTPTWSQDVDQVASNPVRGSNIMYTLHFYAGTHKDNIRNKLTTARAAGTPVFISEFSICDASGNGGIDYTSADAWKKLINETNVSYCGWSFANKNETSALIKPSCSSTDCFTDNDLSETGVWLKGLISGH